MESLIQYFNNYVTLTNDEINFIKDNTSIQRVPKNQFLLQEGKVAQAFYFIMEGSARLFYVSKGEEKTAYFYTENMFVSSYQSFTKQVPSEHNITTTEDSQLIIFDFMTVQKFIQFSSTFEQLARIMMEEELSAYQKMISSFITKNAEERYTDLVDEKPDLIQRIPQHQIATYLGVSAETLSRIRKRVMNKNIS